MNSIDQIKSPDSVKGPYQLNLAANRSNDSLSDKEPTLSPAHSLPSHSPVSPISKFQSGLSRASTMNDANQVIFQPRSLGEKMKTTMADGPLCISSQSPKEDSEYSSLMENKNISLEYRLFVKLNLANYEIINLYFDELNDSPYEENLQNDISVGKWLDEILPHLSQQLFPLLPEVAKYRVDTSVLDLYKNLLVAIGKRYDLQMKLRDLQDGAKTSNSLLGNGQKTDSQTNMLKLLSSPKPRTRRLSRSNLKKNLRRAIQGKYNESHVPRFMKKRHSLEETFVHKSIELWQKQVAIGAQKIQLIIKSLHIIHEMTRQKKLSQTGKPIPKLTTMKSFSIAVGSTKCTERKFSAISLLKNLLKNSPSEETPASRNRNQSPKKQSMVEGEFFKKTTYKECSSLSLLNTEPVDDYKLVLKLSDSEKKKQVKNSQDNIDEELEKVAESRRKKRRAFVEDLDIEQAAPIDNGFKMKLIESKKDESKSPSKNHDTAGSSEPSSTSFPIGAIPEESEDPSKSNFNSPLNSQTPLSGASFSLQVQDSASKQECGTPLLNKKPSINESSNKVTSLQMGVDSEVMDPLSPLPRKITNGDITPGRDRLISKVSNCSPQDSFAEDLDRNFRKFDQFLTSAKKHSQIINYQPNPQDSSLWDKVPEKLYFSDTEAEKRKTVRRKYEDIQESVGVKDFEFLAPLGEGGFGSVWLVRRKSTEDLYALKLIRFNNQDPNFIESMVNENRILMNLVGDYVVKGVFSFIHKRYYCVVMELMVGGDFCKLLEENTAFYEEDAKFYAAELAVAVSHIHKQNITHRDLKPGNMLLDNKGHLKLADFGLSDQQEDSSPFLDKVNVRAADLDVSIQARKRTTPYYEYVFLTLETGQKQRLSTQRELLEHPTIWLPRLLIQETSIVRP